jgi:predicted nucleotidyltransferase
MAPDKLIDEFVERLRTAAGPNLLSVLLYGSAAAGDFVPEYSDVNLLCVLRETSFAAIEALAPAIEWWGKKNHRVPLLMSAEEMRRSADVFSIEFLDMRRNHRLLWGEDLLKTLEIPLRLHRAQLEYELREKTILLRQHLLTLGSNVEGKWELLLRSLSTFGTLFRHALIALGETDSGTKRESAFALAAKLGINADVYRELLDIREKKSDRKSAKLDDLFARYLQLVEEVTASVDKMLDSAA